VTVLQPGAHITNTVQLVRQLGQGGMGSVWLADHRALGTQVVVKFMMASLALDQAAVARFSREAAAAAQVKSPHVVQTLDHGVTPEGIPFIVMELLEGRDLAKYLAERRALSPQETVAIVDQLCRALERAHQKGIVHRDIKPENIFLCDVGHEEVFVKLLDFGIAKTGDIPGVGSATKTGLAIGTPYYMSPEQSLGSKSIDHRTDIWSVGVVTFECLTGVKPFEGDTIAALALALHHGVIPVPSSRANWLPPAVDAWFLQACARNVAERYGSARALSDGLRVALGGAPRASSVDIVGAAHSGSLSGTSGRLSTSTSSAAATAVSAEQLPMRSSQPLLLALVAALALVGGGFAAWKVLGARTDVPAPAVTSATAAPSVVETATPEPVRPAPVVIPSATAPSVVVQPQPAPPAPSAAIAAAPKAPPRAKTAAPKAAQPSKAPPPAAAPPPAQPKPRPANRDDIE